MTEGQHQAAIFKWSKTVRQKYPKLKLLHHIPNERKCSAVQGANLKRRGVRRGVPDLHLPVAMGKYHSLYIELKKEGEITTTDQDWWIDELSAEGNYCEVCHGWESAIQVIEWYMNLKG